MPEIYNHPWYNTQHHVPGEKGFQNIWGINDRPPLSRIIPWFIKHEWQHRSHHPAPLAPVSLAYLHQPVKHVRITWLGHSAFLVQLPGLNILTDPMLGNRASPFPFAGPKRLVPVPFRLSDLPNVHLVLLSHDHYDHLDKGSIQHINRLFNPLFLAPLKVEKHLSRWGITQWLSLDWWQYTTFKGLTFHCTPARHFSGRWLHDRNQTLWAGWMLSTPHLSIYFAGDTAYAPFFKEIADHLMPPQIALLPIGAYEPHWLMQSVHMNPEEATRAYSDLKATHFIPMHWGTFDLADEPLDEPPERLKQAFKQAGLPLSHLHLLAVGACWEQ